MKTMLVASAVFLFVTQSAMANCKVREVKRVTINEGRNETTYTVDKEEKEVVDGRECFELANSLLGSESVGSYTHSHTRHSGKSSHSVRVTHKNCTFRTVKVVARFKSEETKQRFVLKEK